MAAAKFALVGSGWRAEFFRKLAGVLPGELELSGVAVRRAERAEQLRADWGVPAFLSPLELLEKGRPDFVVTTVLRAVNPDMPRAPSSSGRGRGAGHKRPGLLDAYVSRHRADPQPARCRR
jgi:hypothetical protein